MFKYLLSLLLISICFNVHAQAQEMVTKHTGEKIFGITREHPLSIEMYTFESQYHYISKEDIESREIIDIIFHLPTKQITGYIANVYKNEVVVTTAEGDITIDKDKIKYISIPEKYTQSESKSSIPTTKSIKKITFDFDNLYNAHYSKSYALAGVVINSYESVGFMIGYNFDKIALRGQFSFMSQGAGAQLNAGYILGKTPSFEHNISLGIGAYSRSEDFVVKDWTYGGAYYNVNLYGVFLEAGLTFGNGEHSSPKPSIQIGYVFRFNER